MNPYVAWVLKASVFVSAQTFSLRFRRDLPDVQNDEKRHNGHLGLRFAGHYTSTLRCVKNEHQFSTSVSASLVAGCRSCGEIVLTFAETGLRSIY